MKLRIFFISIAALSSMVSSAQQFSALGAGLRNNGFIYTYYEDTVNNILYAGGEFSQIDGQGTSLHIASWNGSTWTSYGQGITGMWSSGGAFAFEKYNGELYVAGGINSIDGNVVDEIAKWNGSTWVDVGLGFDDYVYSLQVYNGELYAGGEFSTADGNPVPCLAKWNGTSWSQVGGGITGTVVRDITVHNGELYVAGYFSNAGSTPVNNIAKWNGSTWSAVGTGANSTIMALQVLGGELYAGGNFTTAGGNPANRVAKWNGSAWSSLSTGVDNIVWSLGTYNNMLVVGGDFLNAGGSPSERIAAWTGSTWTVYGSSGADNSVRALAEYNNTLYAGGTFCMMDGTQSYGMATWAGSYWMASQVYVFDFYNMGEANAMAEDTVNDKLYVGGEFRDAGGVVANHVAVWDGQNWADVGGGVTGIAVSVNAMLFFNGELIVAGSFNTAGGNPASRIARWNGSSWSPLGMGLNNDVFDMTIFNGELYVCGTFTMAGGNPANRLAKWNGSTWSAVGTGLDNGAYALGVHNGALYIGGVFLNANGSPATRIVKYDGTNWTPLGTGVNNNVRALYSYQGELYVGGTFTSAGGVPQTSRMAKWDGSNWFSIGVVSGNGVMKFMEYDGDLFMAGNNVSSINSIPVRCIARYNGTTWSALGNGMTNSLNQGLCVNNSLGTYRGRLHVGGSFNNADNTVMYGIARYNCVEPGFALTSNGALSFCTGGSVGLDAGPGFNSYLWSNGATTQTISAGTSGNYSVIVNTACGTDTSASVTVNVYSLPSVSFTQTPGTACINWPAFALSAGTPAGGTYSGTGVSGNMFDPSVSGAGTFSIIYTYTDSNGCTNADTSQITVGLCTSVGPVNALTRIHIYPNPSSGKFNVQVPVGGAEIMVYSVLGVEVHRSILRDGVQEVELSHLAKGVYVVKVLNDGMIIAAERIIIE